MGGRDRSENENKVPLKQDQLRFKNMAEDCLLPTEILLQCSMILFFGHAPWLARSSFPNWGSNLGPQQWKQRVLTTGPPGNSLIVTFLEGGHYCLHCPLPSTQKHTQHRRSSSWASSMSLQFVFSLCALDKSFCLWIPKVWGIFSLMFFVLFVLKGTRFIFLPRLFAGCQVILVCLYPVMFQTFHLTLPLSQQIFRSLT